MKRLLFGALSVGLVVGFAAACTSDPTEVLRGEVSRVSMSQSFLQILVGDSVQVIARALDDQGNVQSSLPVATTGDASIATVSPNADLTLKPATQTYFFIKGVGYGTGIVMATDTTGGGAADTVDVETFPASIAITGVPDTMRSGDVATYVLTPVDVNGAAVTGFSGLVTVVDDSDILILDTTAATVDADEAGFASINVVGPGPTTGPTEGTFGVRVVPGVPATAALSGTTFGGMAAAGTSTLELIVSDANGNQNNVIDEITSATAVSTDDLVATAAVAVVDTMEGGTLRQVFVTVTGVASGSVTISGDITTSAGVLTYTSAPATVLAPIVTATNPSGAYASTITINGTGLTATGFETLVLVDGKALGNILSASATTITAQAPTFGLAGTWNLQVSVGGVLADSNSTWTQVGVFNPADFPILTDSAETAPQISVPAAFSGSFAGVVNVDQMFRFTLSDDETVNITISWNPAKDLDFIMNDCFVTATVRAFGCYLEFIDPSGGSVEPDLDAGDYLAWVNDYDAEVNANADATTYTLVIERQ